MALVMDNAERLCLAQISNTLLKSFSYNEIHNRRVALGITCVQCTPVQLELLRRAGAMPVSSRRCGMITKREAERLCKSFLAETAPPKLPDSFSFEIQHQCAWGCRGAFNPSRYNSSRAKCIKCCYCGLFFSPNKFIFHSHRLPESKYVQPDAANFNSWRRHIKLYGSPPDEIMFAWEDVKAMFNGGSRKRAMAASLTSVSKQQQQRRQQAQQLQQQQNQLSKSKQNHSPSQDLTPEPPSKRPRLSCGSRSSASPPESRRHSPNIFPTSMVHHYSGDKSSPPLATSGHPAMPAQLQPPHHSSSSLPGFPSPYSFPFLPKAAYGALIQGLTAGGSSPFSSGHASVLGQHHGVPHMNHLGLMVPESLGFSSGSGAKLSPSSSLALHPDVRQSFAEFMGTQPSTSLLPYNYLQLSKYWSQPRVPASLDSSSSVTTASQGMTSSTSSTSSSSRSSSGVMDVSPRSLSNNFHHHGQRQQQLVSMMSSDSSGNRNVRRDSVSPDNNHSVHGTPLFFPSSQSSMEKALQAVAAASVVASSGHGSWDSLRNSGERTSVGHTVTHTNSSMGSAFKPLRGNSAVRSFSRNNSSSTSCLNSSSFRAENLIAGSAVNSRRSSSQDSITPPLSESVKSGDNEDDDNDDDDEVDVIGDEANNNCSFSDRTSVKFNTHEISLGSSGRCPSRRRDEDLDSSSHPIEVSLLMLLSFPVNIITLMFHFNFHHA